jgi:transcriptional regulator with XRE-family HTH domain
MPKLVGPTIPRWQLGEALKRLRQAAGVSELEVAKRLGCSESKIKKLEGGGVGMNRAELIVMLDMFGVEEEEVREPMLDLHAQSRQRGWWSPYGQLPAKFAQFLSLESSATKMRIFEPLMVTGLLQTEPYARAIYSAHTPDLAPEEVDRQVQIKMDRQRRLLEDPPELWVILDEAVLHRPIGSDEIMADQLHHLARVAHTREPGRINLHVIPYSHGGYAGQLGAFSIFEYDEAVHSPVVYIEGQGGNLVLHDERDLSRCSLAYEHMAAAALSRPKSAELIEAAADQFINSARTNK